MFAEAARLQRENKHADAARAYKRLLLLKPDHAEAINNLGVVLLAQGKRAEASACFARALTLMPQLFSPFAGVCTTLAAVNPTIAQAMARAMQAWPAHLSLAQLLDGASLDRLAADPMLICILQSTVVRDLTLECALTTLRAHLQRVALDAPAGSASELALGCAIARQCFINEYVFATTREEDAGVAALKARLADAIASGAAMAPMVLAALATYLPLHALPNAAALLDRAWPAPLAGVVTQQLREPLEELALRATIPRLTAIDDDVSLRVQRQYEENPYPRWLSVAGGVEPVKHRPIFARHVPDRAVHAARQDRRPRLSGGRLRHRLARHRHRAEISRRPAAGDRSEPQQSLLRQAQHAGRRSTSASNTRKPIS